VPAHGELHVSGGVPDRVRAFAVRDPADRGERVMVVASPPGGGKTGLAADAAVAACSRGLRVGVACPRASQALALVGRIRAAFPHQAVRLSVGKHQPVPARVREETRAGRYGGNDAVPDSATITVGTVAKLAYAAGDGDLAWDLLVLEEAWQVTLAEFAPFLGKAGRLLLVGDPGQLPPVVRVATEPVEVSRYRVHAPVAAELPRHVPDARFLRLGVSYRLPPDTVRLLQPPYYPDLPFAASSSPDERGLASAGTGARGDAVDRALDLLGGGASLVVLELPGRSGGPDHLDPEATALMAEVVGRMRERGIGPAGGTPFRMEDVGCIDPHVAGVEALGRLVRSPQVRLGTPEIWQGLERALIVARLPEAGGEGGSGFAFEPGRACVSLSRHRFGCVAVARASVEGAGPGDGYDFGARPLGGEDRVWRGVQARQELWRGLRRLGRVVPA
jgi:hypothetical protein